LSKVLRHVVLHVYDLAKLMSIIYYASIWLVISIDSQRLVKAFNAEFYKFCPVVEVLKLCY